MKFFSKEAHSYASLFQKHMVLITSIVILTIGTFWITEEYFWLNIEATKHYQQSTSLIKHTIRNEVLKIVKLINHTKSKTESNLKADIREITYQAPDHWTYTQQHYFQLIYNRFGGLRHDASIASYLYKAIVLIDLPRFFSLSFRSCGLIICHKKKKYLTLYQSCKSNKICRVVQHENKSSKLSHDLEK